MGRIAIAQMIMVFALLFVDRLDGDLVRTLLLIALSGFCAMSGAVAEMTKARGKEHGA